MDGGALQPEKISSFYLLNIQSLVIVMVLAIPSNVNAENMVLLAYCSVTNREN